MAWVNRNSTVTLDTSLSKNRWRWEWLDETDKNDDKLSAYIRKLKEDGRAVCIWDNNKIRYGGKGCAQIKTHAESEVHKKANCALSNNTALGGSYTAVESDGPSQTFVSIWDRKWNQQAYVLAFAAEIPYRF